MASAAAAAAARFSLCGQGALVTGGTKGIGLAIAKELTQLGATVVACARSVDDAATRELPEGVHTVQADVANRSEREALMSTTEQILRENGTPLSILINSERPRSAPGSADGTAGCLATLTPTDRCRASLHNRRRHEHSQAHDRLQC